MARADAASWENTRVAFNDELVTLVNEVADRVDRWTGHDAWTFEPRFVGVGGGREHGDEAGRLAVGGASRSDRLPVRADGDQAGGGAVPLCGAADRGGAAGAGH
jgi:hypothetical protein